MSMQAVILAGGKGTRLAPFTTIIPKPLVPIGPYPILEILLRQLKHYGIVNITLALNHHGELIQAYFGDGSRFGVRLRYSHEGKPLGTAGPLSLLSRPRSSFFVLNGDLFTTMNFRSMLDAHTRSGAMATVGVHRHVENIEFGVLDINEKKQILGYHEKPEHAWDVSMGIYVLEPAALRFVPHGKYFDLPDLIRALLREGKAVSGFANKGYWLDIGRPHDYEKAVALFTRNPKRFLPESPDEGSRHRK
ncbi:MAG: Nucleotidyl transferase [Candidatus Uhrbacteria bacterium GW2011_GWA2_52_8d]|uniref:Nucleotidyl transferase n=1 Tax=Candidatus Uhrbacteria bacterium GW2011_GWA2_52_8d TaxID=1618979 RepID=A0A0G1XMI8_9BACT|nr:MAG: Nucleotidyl transferase [Candidatus Uhrbacteria bacterium GW2011_GWA2_52_8d]